MADIVSQIKGTNGTTYNLEDKTTSGVTAGSYGPSANATPAHGGTFTVPYFQVNSYGKITSAANRTITLPTDQNTDTKVTQTLTSSNAEYPILFSGGGTSGTAQTAYFATGMTYNPSTQYLNMNGGQVKTRISLFGNTRQSTPNLTADGKVGLSHFLATSTMGNNRPMTSDGHILHMAWDTTAGWDTQLYIKNNSNPMVRVRGQNAGTWGTWYKVYSELELPTLAELNIATTAGTGLTKSGTQLQHATYYSETVQPINYSVLSESSNSYLKSFGYTKKIPSFSNGHVSSISTTPTFLDIPYKTSFIISSAADNAGRSEVGHLLIQWNTASVTTASSASGGVYSGAVTDITFTSEYANKPTILLSWLGAYGANGALDAYSITTTGFNFRARTLTASQTRTVMWIAIGKRKGS